jgi:hypothetical protein
MAQVSNQKLDDLYRQKYQTNDRAWLQSEARRDPQQFLDVAKRIGVSMPQPGEPSTVVDPNAFGKAVMTNAATPAMPVAPPAMPAALPAPPPVMPAPPAMIAPPPGPVAPPPVILGPNGMPLPATGVT